jgi:hypothetical protein
MDAGVVLVVILLIGSAGWLVWVSVTSNRRTRESGNTAADGGGADRSPQPLGASEPPGRLPLGAPDPTGARARATRSERTSPRAGRRRP